jgi:DNA-binding CsgD family transcriptional regulator
MRASDRSHDSNDPRDSNDPADPNAVEAPSTVMASPRRKRFERAATAEHMLTPLKIEALRLLAESRFLSTAQVERIMGWSDKTARGHLRDLYDLGLTDRLPVPGAVLGTTALLAANVHYPTRAGVKALERLGLLPDGVRTVKSLHPTRYLAHELGVRDVLAWLSVSARRYALHAPYAHRVEHWDCSPDLTVFHTTADAVFTYRIAESGKGSVLAGIVEVDRDSERQVSGGRGDRWAAKVEAYDWLFSTEGAERLRVLTGFRRARLLVTVPSAARAEWVARRLAGTLAAPDTRIGVQAELDGADVFAPVWLTPEGGSVALLHREEGPSKRAEEGE